MGTRARVGIVNSDGSITYIYTHCDGYPEHHAPILLGHYNTPEKVAELLALGDLSSLAQKIGEKHDFDSRERRDWCTAYGRDRNERECEAIVSPSKAAFEAVATDCGAEYAYLLEDGVWSYSSVPWVEGRVFRYESLTATAERSAIGAY